MKNLTKEKELPMKYYLALEYDHDVESPCENDGSWKLYSFNRHHNNYRDPHYFLKPNGEGANIGIQRKMDYGTAFILSCYDHSGSIYSLKGEGMQCRWDTTQIAGILVWEESVKNMGAKIYDDRKKDARSFLSEYNSWLNGDCYYYCLEDENGENIDSCGGYIGSEYFKKVLREDHPELFEDGVELEVTGEAKWILE